MPWSWTHLKFNFSIFKTAVLGTPQDKIRPSLAAPGHWRSLVTSLAGASWAVPCNGLALLLDDMAHPHRDVSITCEKIMFCKLKPHKDGISSGKRGCSKIKKMDWTYMNYVYKPGMNLDCWVNETHPWLQWIHGEYVFESPLWQWSGQLGVPCSRRLAGPWLTWAGVWNHSMLAFWSTWMSLILNT